MKLRLLKRVISLFMIILITVTASPYKVGAEGTISPDDAVSETINGYYKQSEGYLIDDWEELAAVSAAGEDIREFQLPETPAAGSTAVLTALIKGDSQSARKAGEDMVIEGILNSAGYAYGDALNMLALEAYNRSATVTDEVYSITYDKATAVRDFLEYVEADGGFGYGSGGDPDTTGLALVALSLYTNDIVGGAPAPYCTDVSEAITDAKSYLHEVQQSNGGFSSWGVNNANSAAVVMWGLESTGEDPYGSFWKKDGKSISDALLSFYVDGGGFGYSDNSDADSFATKEAVIALADPDYLSTLALSAKRYMSVNVQVVKADSSYEEKVVTVTDEETVSKAVARALGETDVSTSDYSFFINNVLNNKPDNHNMKEGDTVLAIYKDFEAVAYFKTENEDIIGINTADIPFGGSKELTLVQSATAASDISAGSSIMSGIPVDFNGDGYSDGYTDTEGKITVSPIEAKTITIAAIRGEYASYPPYEYEEYIASTVALLPAKITMEKGATQIATVSVRVEGISENIAYDKALTVGNNGSKKLTVWDAVKSILEEGNINYNWTGSYLYSINDVDYAAGGGWMYVVNGSSVWTGMDAQTISDGDEIVVYYCNTSYDTVYPIVRVSMSADKCVIVSVSNGSIPLSGVNVCWAGGTDYWYTAITGSDGKVTIPAEKAPAGRHSLQISKPGTGGLPDVLRLAPDYFVTVNSSGTNNPINGGSGAKYVYIKVTGPNGTLLEKTQYGWYKDMSALDILKATSLTVLESGAYVISIEGIAEFDYGPNSGWLYKVNGNESITVAAAKYTLAAGDYVEWFYSGDYSKEKGSDSWNSPGSSSNNGTGSTAGISNAAGESEIVSIAIDEAALEKLLRSIADGGGTQGTVGRIVAETPETAAGMNLTIPKVVFNALLGSPSNSLEIQSSMGLIKLNPAAIAGITEQMGAEDIVFSFKKVNISELSEDNRAIANNHPVYDLTLTAKEKIITDFKGGKAAVSIPYNLAYGEDPSGLTIYHIDSQSKAFEIKDVAYDSTEGLIIFETEHFSIFAVAYKQEKAVPYFIDIPEGYWAYEYISYLARNGIIKGVSQSTFLPFSNITRGEAAAMLARMSGDKLPLISEDFGDVQSNSWYGAYMKWSVNVGVISGTGKNEYLPMENITREDMAVMLYRYAKYKGFNLKASVDVTEFLDKEEIYEYAAEAVETMQKAGIINGRKGNLFEPKDFITRDEAAKMLAVLLKMME